MKFGLGLPGLILYPPVMSPWEVQATGNDVLRIAKKADELGFDWLTVSEHIVMPHEMSEIMGPRYPEALAAASVIAGATERIKLLPYILVLPYRNPVVLAKQIATLDFLSGGRFALGTAAGHLEREFDILNVPFHERGARTDEYLRAMKELWTSDSPSFHGRYVEFDDIVFEPKPVQQPHPPILVGGNSRPAMRRAAALGDGWLPWLITRDKLPAALSFVREQPGYKEPFEVVMPLATLNVEDYTHRELGKTRAPRERDDVIEEIGRLGDAGATTTLVAPPRTKSADQAMEWLEWFAAEVMPALSGKPTTPA
ncbi:MAG: TIGR03619 family F420-dependent LLM class oxidoreductase [Dehalococcoidia bacterium]|nr:TIGR03619 family F420-dependent LLM class oxidoreductase [Dehalococcoidia bacterium]